MNRIVLIFLLSVSALSTPASAQSAPGTAGQSAPGNKTDDQADRTSKPKNRTGARKRRVQSDPITVPPIAAHPTTPTDPAMPSDPKTPTSPTAPRTPIKPTDPTRPEDPTKPTVPPPVI